MVIEIKVDNIVSCLYFAFGCFKSQETADSIAFALVLYVMLWNGSLLHAEVVALAAAGKLYQYNHKFAFQSELWLLRWE